MNLNTLIDNIAPNLLIIAAIVGVLISFVKGRSWKQVIGLLVSLAFAWSILTNRTNLEAFSRLITKLISFAGGIV